MPWAMNGGVTGRPTTLSGSGALGRSKAVTIPPSSNRRCHELVAGSDTPLSRSQPIAKINTMNGVVVIPMRIGSAALSIGTASSRAHGPGMPSGLPCTVGTVPRESVANVAIARAAARTAATRHSQIVMTRHAMSSDQPKFALCSALLFGLRATLLNWCAMELAA
jgi:hypothetical protein